MGWDDVGWGADVRGEEDEVDRRGAWYGGRGLGKQADDTLPYLTERRLDVWTHNKAIQKAVESYRISPELKQRLREMRIRA